MKKAIAGYTPNVPWMRYDDTPNGWDLDGGGTSAATPQIAAACALWLAKYGDQFPAGWVRVQACRMRCSSRRRTAARTSPISASASWTPARC